MVKAHHVNFIFGQDSLIIPLFVELLISVFDLNQLIKNILLT